ncbi:MAG: dTMP kinase [Betaproteobacteria bacterium]|nr:MAG: dTMP kinase [Betaproteobacteria bacterium]
MKARFITLEGVDGAGKSSFVPWIEQRLRAAGRPVLVTREPGGTPAGEQLRSILLHGDVRPETEVLLLFAARKEHLDKVILPALRAGTWVLCDRFTDATFAYQGSGRGVDREHIAHLERWIQGGVQPDLTILFDLPVDVARARSASARHPDRFESEQMDFFDRVRAGYRMRATADPGRIRVIDASRSMSEVEAQLAAIELLR